MKRLLGVLLVVGLIAWGLLETSDRGRWSCGVCGRLERQWRVAQLTVTREERLSAYFVWFEAHITLPHEHEWIHRGCHHTGWFGSGVACSDRRLDLHEAILEMKDPEQAIRTATRLAMLEETHRLREMDEAERADLRLIATLDLSSPRVLEGHAREIAKYAEWWNTHPMWRECFPEPPKP